MNYGKTLARALLLGIVMQVALACSAPNVAEQAASSDKLTEYLAGRGRGDGFDYPNALKPFGSGYEHAEFDFSHEGVHLRINHVKPVETEPVVSVFAMGGGPMGFSFHVGGTDFDKAIFEGTDAEFYFVEHAGSPCCDERQIRRLEREGLPTLEKDANALVAFIRSRKETPVQVIGSGSFSTSIGILALTAIGPNEPGEPCTLGLFSAPVIRLMHSSYVYNRDNKVFPPYHNLDERAQTWRYWNKRLMHYDEDLETDPAREWLASVRARADIQVPIAVALPRFDSFVDLDELERFFGGFEDATVFTPTYEFHQTMSTSKEVRAFLNGFVREQLADPDCGGSAGRE